MSVTRSEPQVSWAAYADVVYLPDNETVPLRRGIQQAFNVVWSTMEDVGIKIPNEKSCFLYFLGAR